MRADLFTAAQLHGEVRHLGEDFGACPTARDPRYSCLAGFVPPLWTLLWLGMAASLALMV
jgi:tryptophan-rich sensory protein